MKTAVFTVLAALFISVCAFGQSGSKIIVPEYNDKYSKYVKQLEDGKLDIDFQDFRFSFLESEQFNKAGESRNKLDSLKNIMYSKWKTNDYSDVIGIAQQILSIDYTFMNAHEYLRSAYKKTGDSKKSAKYESIELGLIESITSKGDGKTCETGWPVIQVSEEYFLLHMLGAKNIKQSLSNEGGICDAMESEIDGKTILIYFDISKVMEAYQKMFTR